MTPTDDVKVAKEFGKHSILLCETAVFNRSYSICQRV